MNDIDTLHEINILAGLPKEDLQDISRYMSPVNLPKGSYLFYRNDESGWLYLVASGSLQVIIDNDANREIIVCTIKSGDIIGEMSLFSNSPRSATAIALEDTKLFKIENSKFIELMASYPAAGINLSKVLVDRLMSANQMIERLGAMDGTERVTDFMKALVAREGIKDGEDMCHVENRPTYHEIAQRLGVSEKTVYRTMRSLSKDGAIKVTGKKLIVKPSILGILE
ncbi:hypothetical protein MNBD_NITROSPINAE01-579 [hydrothermal vent metagenome]|uniref:Cyclic nucleotide-binding domain-containing protein n=1 Tax=hydrothermal vent metagenome TaxID=652676 RepID=A0A3B1BRV2_9ZZZZ